MSDPTPGTRGEHPPTPQGPEMSPDDLRRHLRDFHHLDVEYLRIVPDGALVVEHDFHHEDGLDIEPHVHQGVSHV